MRLSKKAQSIIEYALIMAVIAIVALTVLTRMGRPITGIGRASTSAVSDDSANTMDEYCVSIGRNSFNAGANTCN